MTNKSYFKIIIIIFLIFLMIILIKNLSYRNVNEIAENAPEFTNNHGIVLIKYNGCKGNIIYGGFVKYNGIDDDGNLYKITVTKWEDELMVYEITKIE